MMAVNTIKLDVFGGLMPRVDPLNLADSMATKAENCRLHTTKLNPIRKPQPVSDFPIHMQNGMTDIRDAKTIVLWTRGDGYRDVIAWPGIVHVATSNINDDDRFRIFVTGDTGINDNRGENQPCAFVSSRSGPVFDQNDQVIGYSSPVTFDVHPLTKDSPPNVEVKYWENSSETDSVELDPATIRHTYFFQTYVDEYGYESGISDVAKDIYGNINEFDYNNNQKVVWKGINTVPSWVVKRYLYMAVTGESTNSIAFVCEQTVAEDGSFGDLQNININDQETVEECPQITPIPPDLDWMTQMPGNFYVGFCRSNPRQVCFSDVSVPTSWPEAYRYAIRDYAIGIAVAGNTAFILTKGYPWAISGTAPEGMTAAQIVSEQACVAVRSICTFEGKVFYASQDGICMLSEDSLTSTVITRSYWDKPSWTKLKPETCIMRAYDNALFCWFEEETYIIDFDAGGNPMITQTDERAKSIFVDVETDKLYFVGR